jgi:ketosteroid isomerase-like protein
MAGEAEAVVRRVYDMFTRAMSVDAAFAEFQTLLHPDAEYVNPPDAVEPGTRRGIDGWRAALSSTAEGLGQDASFEVKELVERGERVFALVSLRTGGTASGVEVDGPTIGTVWTVRDGLVCRFVWCWKPEDARAIFDGS